MSLGIICPFCGDVLECSEAALSVGRRLGRVDVECKCGYKDVILIDETQGIPFATPN